MICSKCGALMDQTDKDSSSGRVIREYLCRNCGHSDWEDDGVALWQVLHDAREADESERAAQAATSAAPEAAPPGQNRRASLWQRLTNFLRGKR